MNTKTKITLIIGLLAIVASCVYPPWQVVTGRGHAWSDGYAFMFAANLNKEAASRYSPAEVVKAERTIVSGMPDVRCISTSHVESQNLTLRMHCRRLTRLTNAFSKKIENFEAAVALNFAYYNFCKVHISIRCTPAMQAGVENSQWTVAELVEHCGE